MCLSPEPEDPQISLFPVCALMHQRTIEPSITLFLLSAESPGPFGNKLRFVWVGGAEGFFSVGFLQVLETLVDF